jgi:hypothetical protein
MDRLTILKLLNKLEMAPFSRPIVKLFFHQIKNQRKPAHTLAIIEDYLRLKKKSHYLKKTWEPCCKRTKVLIVSLSDFIYQIKLEAMLGKALQLAGCDVQILTYKYSIWAKNYFRLFGLNKFVDFDIYLNKWRKYDVKKELASLLNQRVSFQEVKKWRFKGARIGQQVLSTIARRMYGTPCLSHKDIYELFVFYLEKEIRAIYAAHTLLDEIHPDLLLFNEANGMIYGAIFDCAFNRGLNVIQFVQPLREDSLIFKRYDTESFGLHPNSLSKSTFEQLKYKEWTSKQEEALQKEFSYRYQGKWFLSKRNQLGKVQKTKDEIIKQLGLDRNKKTAIIFSHILWDANLFYGEDLFEDYEDWFIQTIKIAIQNSKVNWIVKMHPANMWKRDREKAKGILREEYLIKKEIGKLPPHIYLLYPDTDINTFSLFHIADYGITVRGTVGMELPCYGVPVFTAGSGRYSGLGFTIDSISKEDYIEKLLNIQEYPPLNEKQTLLAKKHAYGIFILRPWLMKSFRAEFKYQKKGIHPLDHNLYPNIKSFIELSEAEDLKKFSYWALESSSPDYLEDWDKVYKI